MTREDGGGGCLLGVLELTKVDTVSLPVSPEVETVDGYQEDHY